MRHMFAMFREKDRLMDTQIHVYRVEPRITFNGGLAPSENADRAE